MSRVAPSREGLRKIAEGSPLKKPWLLQRDGDLWKAYWQAIVWPASVTHREVKGHSTKEDVQMGIITQGDHVGNTASDAAAEVCIDPVLEQLGAFYAQRHQSYCKLVEAAHDIIIAVM